MINKSTLSRVAPSVGAALLCVGVAACGTSASNPTASASPSVSAPVPSPLPTLPGDVRIAAAGDIACSPDDPAFNGGQGTGSGIQAACRQKYTADLIQSNIDRYAKVFVLGDMQYQTAKLATEILPVYNKTWGQFKAKTMPVQGNHDSSEPGYFQYWNGTNAEGQTNPTGPAGAPGFGWYSFDTGDSATSGWHVVALNSECSELSDCWRPQLEWLKQDLAASKKPCTIAMWHNAVFWTNDKMYDEPKEHGEPMEHFYEALYDHGAEVVLNGDHEYYARLKPADIHSKVDPAHGIRAFMVGTGGRSLRTPLGSANPDRTEAQASSSFGVLEMELKAGSYTWKFVPAKSPGNGTYTDAGTAKCHAAPSGG